MMPPEMEQPKVTVAIGTAQTPPLPIPMNEGETLKVVIPTEAEGTPLFEAILMMP